MSEDADEDAPVGEDAGSAGDAPEAGGDTPEPGGDVDEEDLEERFEEDPAAAFEATQDVPGTHVRATEFWDEVVADMEATAAEYESAGWETLQVHPGDVTALSPDGEDDLFGLDLLAPNDEFDAVEELLADGVSFDAYEAYRATGNGLVLLVVAMEDDDAEVAVLFPAYYDPSNAQAMLAAARRAGEMHTYLRTLTNERIEFTHDDPENFAPPGEDGLEEDDADDADATAG